MKLIFIRHGQATAYCADDAGRNLTEFGQAQALEMAEHLTQNHQIDLIIASPFNRADQTARILQKTLIAKGAMPNFITLDGITPDDDPKVALDAIEAVTNNHFEGQDGDKTIAIVCHMPIVAKMVAILDVDGLPAPMFDLAEYRVLQTQVIAPTLAVQLERFSPRQP